MSSFNPHRRRERLEKSARRAIRALAVDRVARPFIPPASVKAVLKRAARVLPRWGDIYVEATQEARARAAARQAKAAAKAAPAA